MNKVVIIPFIVCMMFLPLFVSPVFAAGNLTINFTSMAPAYANTNQSYDMLLLNLTVDPSTGDGTVNITSINITLAGTASVPDISAVEIKNSTGSVIAATTSNITSQIFKITIANGFVVNASTNANLTVAFNISASAASLKTVAANLNVTNDVNTTSTVDNIIIGASSTSSYAHIQDVHASATISPKFVDTGVISQSFTYNMTFTGDDTFNVINITIPAGYTVVNVSEIKNTLALLYNSTGYSASGFTVSFTDNKINIDYTSGFTASGGMIRINFTVNTNSSTVNTAAFNSTITGSNMSYVNTTLASANDTNVKTLPVFSIDSVSIIKAAAIINGMDYWEFNFTLNFTRNITTSGLLQFRMNNWNNTNGNILNLNTTASRYYASLRRSDNSSNTFNVTNDYNFIQGVSFSLNTNAEYIYYVILKMIIPTGTPVSSSWWTTYYALFRSSP